MFKPTHSVPQTRGTGAAVLLLSTLAAVVVLAVVSIVHPEPVGGVAVLALLLGIVGIVVGAVGEGGAR